MLIVARTPVKELIAVLPESFGSSLIYQHNTELSCLPDGSFELDGVSADTELFDDNQKYPPYCGPRRFLRFHPQTRQLEYKHVGQSNYQSHKAHTLYVPDDSMSVSGFRTAQRLLKIGYTYEPGASLSHGF